MKNKNLSLLLLLLLVTNVTTAQTVDGYVVPRTEYGQPDMQGIWFYGSSTPYERPVELREKKTYTRAEGLELERSLVQASQAKDQAVNPDRAPPPKGVSIVQEADHNFASIRMNPIRIDGLYRTSQIISPANGRFPFREDGKDFFQNLLDVGHGAFDGPEIRPAGERCAGPNGAPMAPMIGHFYNANMQIYQTEDYVVILAEMNHDARIIPINGKPQNNEFTNWMGNSAGHWEGDTLVVETRNFRPEQSWTFWKMSEQLEVVERFTLVANDEIYYSFTATDPEIFSEPVTFEKNIVRRAPDEPIFEYACHEGNYSLPGILAGARRQEMDEEQISD